VLVNGRYHELEYLNPISPRERWGFLCGGKYTSIIRVGIYGDARDGACEICIRQSENWKERVTSGSTVYSGRFKIHFGP